MDIEEVLSQFNSLSEKVEFRKRIAMPTEHLVPQPASVFRACLYCGKKAKANEKALSGKQHCYCLKCANPFLIPRNRTLLANIAKNVT